MNQVTNKTILITGGASGIGKLMALKFAENGNTVIVWDINAGNLEKLTEESAAQKLNIKGMLCDITKKEKVYSTAEEVEKQFGTVDILINNAGVVSGKNFLEAADEEILLSINVNTIAVFWTVKAFLPGMLKKGEGQLVTIASAAGLIGVKKLADYSASKFAAFGFMESMRMELASVCKGITTTTVCPFFIDTGMFKGVHSRFPIFLPILNQEYVAKKIVKAVTKRKPLLIMPFFVNTIFWARLFPVKVFDALANFLGINCSMEHFIGRK